MRRAQSTPLGPTQPKAAAEHEQGPLQKAINAGMGFIMGDILAQRISGEPFDAVRSLELGLYGFVLGE